MASRARTAARASVRSIDRTELPFDFIASKLYPPPVRTGSVSRGALVSRVRGEEGRVVAIIAPPGYGKTTFLTELSETDPRDVAWISLDHHDNDPVVLLAHLAAALDRIDPLDPRVIGAFASPGTSVMSTLLPRVGAALASLEAPVALFLDDLHVLIEPTCHDVIIELVGRLPRGSQLTLSSRSVPSVPLARLRANGDLVEIGVNELALNEEEARLLLRDAGVDLGKEAVAQLTEKTEGWPTGLYLAALSLQAKGDGELQGISFSGEDRFVTDYVRSEILAQLPDDLVQYLTRASVLERMSGSLCDAVVQNPGSSRMLATIEESNLLLVPLDHQRHWYRYHVLFREILATELTSREPDLVPDLHRRAADWHEAGGMIEDAARHAYAAGDVDRAALLLEQLALPFHRAGRFETLKSWMERIDDEVMGRHPLLAVLAGWTAALTGDAIGAAAFADLAEKSALVSDSVEVSAATQSNMRLLRALTCRRGVAAMEEDARFAVESEPEASTWHPAALGLQGVATLLRGDDAGADQILADAVEGAERIGAFPTATVALAERSFLAITRGDWDAAGKHAAQALAHVEQAHLEDYGLSAITFAAVARTAVQRGDMSGARHEVIRVQRLRPILTRAIPWLATQTMIEMARVQSALSDRAGAWAMVSGARDILAKLPDLGILGDQLVQVERSLRQVKGADTPGPTALTPAELRLLPFLPTHLSFREIGDRLFISPNTVKTEAISIYRKLSVSTRTDAVNRARDIGLLDH